MLKDRYTESGRASVIRMAEERVRLLSKKKTICPGIVGEFGFLLKLFTGILWLRLLLGESSGTLQFLEGGEGGSRVFVKLKNCFKLISFSF